MRQRESVAEHQWSTAFIAYVLADFLLCRGVIVSPNRVLLGALLHDMAETATGDMPNPFKHSDPTVASWWRAQERAAVDGLFHRLPQLTAEHLRETMRDDVSTAARLVAFADKLAAFAFARQELEQGNGLFIPICANAAELALALGQQESWWPLANAEFDIERELSAYA